MVYSRNEVRLVVVWLFWFFSGMVFTILLILMATASAMAVEVIGHRGASYDAPENTIRSTRLAFEQGADGTECDVHLSSDNQVVVMHDLNTLATTGVRKEISRSSAEDLRKLNAAHWGRWQSEGKSEPVPLLAELLAVVPSGKKIFVEIKSGTNILGELGKILAASNLERSQIVLIGFNYETMKQAKQRLPAYQSLWIVSSDKQSKQFPALEELIEKTRAANLDGLDLDKGFPIDKAFVQKVHAAGLKLYTWTVDDPKIARKQAVAGVDGITTNRPEWLRKQLSSD